MKGECKKCRRAVDCLSEKGLCKFCTENTLVQMRCTNSDCKHTWKHPGFGAWCPMCGNTNVTSDDKTIDEWMWQKEAEKNGVKFCGMQSGVDEKTVYPIFQDDRTGSFTLYNNETIEQAIDRKIREFFAGAVLQ